MLLPTSGIELCSLLEEHVQVRFPCSVSVVLQECSCMHAAMCEARFPAFPRCAGMDSGMCCVLTLFQHSACCTAGTVWLDQPPHLYGSTTSADGGFACCCACCMVSTLCTVGHMVSCEQHTLGLICVVSRASCFNSHALRCLAWFALL